MTYKLHVNGVLTGSLNSFCLACDSFLKSQQEATEHIGTSDHKKKSIAVQYSDKFKGEHIKKFKGGYYCEFCNVLMPTASKVNLHINEEEHKYNKGILLLYPMGGDVVAFNNIVIKENAWHGLIEGVCSLCNVEFEDEEDHKSDARHSLNLVLKSIQFEVHSAIYRTLDDTAVQCLTCNKLLAPCKMIKHFEDTEHQELYAKCRIESNGVHQEIETKENCQDIETKVCQEKTTNMTSATENAGEIMKPKIDNDRNNNKKPQAKDKSKILEFIAKFQSKGININLETETAFCKKCSQVVTFDLMEIESHIESHSSAVTVDSELLYPSNLNQNLNRVDINDKTAHASDNMENAEVVNETIKALQAEVENDTLNPEDNDTDTEQDEARDFAKANKITYNGNNNHSYCRICKVRLPSSFKSMKEHVEGANHQRVAASLITQPKTPGKQAKKITKEFVDSSYTVQSMFDNYCIVNEEICIPEKSLYFISENNSRKRCILCETNLPSFMSVEEHAKKIHHILKWQKVPVITSEENELIREVRSGLYHCAYCNLVVSGWGDMKQHLECSDHRENRSVGENRLRFHLPNLQRFKMREQLEAMAMMRFFNMF